MSMGYVLPSDEYILSTLFFRQGQLGYDLMSGQQWSYIFDSLESARVDQDLNLAGYSVSQTTLEEVSVLIRLFIIAMVSSYCNRFFCILLKNKRKLTKFHLSSVHCLVFFLCCLLFFCSVLLR